jgi:uncharacterized protein (TIGR02597 family)
MEGFMNARKQKNPFLQRLKLNQLTNALINCFFNNMKFLPSRSLFQVLAIGSLSCFLNLSPASAQTGVATTPVGFMAYTIPGAVNASVPTKTAVAFPLHDTPVYSGTITAVGPASLTNSSSPWQDASSVVTNFASAASPYLVRVRTGLQAGRVMLITANTASQLTVDTRTPALSLTASGLSMAAGDSIDIVPADTLGTLFGTATPIFKSGATADVADNVSVWDDATQAWITYFHNGTQWVRDQDQTLASQNNTVIYPDRALFITRRDTTPVTFTLVGEVPASDQKTLVAGPQAGVVSRTYVANLFPTDTTLASSGIANLTGWKKNADFAQADVVMIWDTTSQTWGAYYNDGAQWLCYPVAGSQDNTVIPAGSAVFIARRSSPTASDSVWNNALPYSLN